MKFNPFATTSVIVGVILLAAFLYRLAVSTAEPTPSTYMMLVFAVVMFVIPWAKKFTLFKVFEFERHDDK